MPSTAQDVRQAAHPFPTAGGHRAPDRAPTIPTHLGPAPNSQADARPSNNRSAPGNPRRARVHTRAPWFPTTFVQHPATNTGEHPHPIHQSRTAMRRGQLLARQARIGKYPNTSVQPALAAVRTAGAGPSVPCTPTISVRRPALDVRRVTTTQLAPDRDAVHLSHSVRRPVHRCPSRPTTQPCGQPAPDRASMYSSPFGPPAGLGTQRRRNRCRCQAERPCTRRSRHPGTQTSAASHHVAGDRQAPNRPSVGTGTTPVRRPAETSSGGHQRPPGRDPSTGHSVRRPPEAPSKRGKACAGPESPTRSGTRSPTRPGEPPGPSSPPVPPGGEDERLAGAPRPRPGTTHSSACSDSRRGRPAPARQPHAPAGRGRRRPPRRSAHVQL